MRIRNTVKPMNVEMGAPVSRLYLQVDATPLEEDPLEDALGGDLMLDIAQILNRIVQLPGLNNICYRYQYTALCITEE